MLPVLPIPPQTTRLVDTKTGQLSEVWRRYFLAIETLLLTGVAPSDAAFWVSTVNDTLTAEQSLGLLASGYLKLTTAAAIGTPSTTTTIPTTDLSGRITYAQFPQAVARSVLGVTGNATADQAPIAAATDNQVLRRSGTSIAFGAVNLASSDAVTGDLPFANLTQGSALSVLGVTGNATADNASIAAASDFQVMRRSGTAVAFGAVDLSQAAAVTGLLPVANVATLASGTYTPTLTNTTNVFASTARLCTYLRVGNSVTVSGQFDIDPIAPAAATLLEISLFITSAFTTAYQAGGTAAALGIAGQCAGIEANVANGTLSVRFISTDITNQTMSFSATYQVI